MTERKYVKSKYVRARYKITDMTIWRWERDPKLGFPKPMIINRQKHWTVEELDAFDARQREKAA